MKRLVAAAIAAAALAVPAAVQAQEPILFVHGWASNGSVWNTMVDRFENDGYASSHLMTFSYNTSQSNVTTASEVATRVSQLRQQTGAAQVDIVAHSMGSLSSRYYLKNLGGQPYVDDWVSLGGPNHGTSTANLCFSTACTQMRPGSTFLTALNSGDETPGTPSYRTWWSPCDEIINPDSSVALSGATNTQTPCIGHLDLLTDAGVYAQVRDAID